MLTDTHCHLDFDTFDPDREAVLLRAQEVGIERFLNPGIDLESCRHALNLAEKFSPVYVAVGVHPNDTNGWSASTVHDLRQMAAHPKVVAIGEIGLDYYRERTPKDTQRRIFREQLDLAGELGLPVVLHCRQADDDMLKMLSQWHEELVKAKSALAHAPGVLHSFSGDLNFALQAVAAHFLIGISGPVTFSNAALLVQNVTQLQAGHLLIETDAPFLTPHPYRGRRNEPAYVRYVAQKISEILDLSVSEVAEKTTENARGLFNW